MKSKGHLITSMVKSSIRMLGALLSSYLVWVDIGKSIQVLIISILIAEMLGIIEEFLDERD